MWGTTSTAIGGAVTATATVPPVPAPALIAAPATIQAALAGGAEPGTMLSAPLAPAKGPIDAKAESLVTVTVKNFFDTPTWKAIRTVLQSALGLVLLSIGGTFMATWSAGKSIFDAGAVNWRAVEIACEISGGGAIVTAVMAWAKKTDNNPSK